MTDSVEPWFGERPLPEFFLRWLTVRVQGEADGQYSPEVTFWTEPRDG